MKFFNTKNLSSKLFFLCLFIFAGFLVNSCRKDTFHSASPVVAKTLTDHHIDIAALQKAYVNGTGSSGLKATDLSGQAIANIISTLNVDWSTYTLQEFADSSKIIEFPMPDDTTLVAPSDSIQNGNNKYKSKTSAVFILHKDTIILNFFMKTVEDLNNPSYQSVIDQQFYLNTPANFNGQIMYFTLDRQFINGYVWKDGSITKTVDLSSVISQSSTQTQSYKGKLKIDEAMSCTTDQYDVILYTIYDGNITHEEVIGSFTVTTCTTVPSGGGSGGSTAPAGGVSGGGGTTPAPPPCAAGSSSGAAVSSVKSGRLVINVAAPPTGGSGGTTPAPQPCPSNPTIPPTVTPAQKATIDKLMKNASSLTAAQKVQVQALLDQILKDCIGQATFDYLSSHFDKFDFLINSTMSAQASYNPASDVINIKNTATLSAQGLEEEFFHAYQNKTTAGGISKYAGNLGAANIEFEAKVLRDMNSVVNGQGGAFAVVGSEYSNFIKNVTNNYNSLPTSFTSAQLGEYFNLMKQFIQDNPGYSNNQIDPSLNPSAMFSLIKSSPCSANQ